MSASIEKSTTVRAETEQRAAQQRQVARLRRVFAVLEPLAPAVGARLAWKLWTAPKQPRAQAVARSREGGTGEVRTISVELPDWTGRRPTKRGGAPKTPRNVEITVELLGPEDGPLVYLLHGWEGWRGQFAPIGRTLAASGHRVVLIDAPNHGDSGPGAFGPNCSLLPDFKPDAGGRGARVRPGSRDRRPLPRAWCCAAARHSSTASRRTRPCSSRRRSTRSRSPGALAKSAGLRRAGQDPPGRHFRAPHRDPRLARLGIYRWTCANAPTCRPRSSCTTRATRWSRSTPAVSWPSPGPARGSSKPQASGTIRSCATRRSSQASRRSSRTAWWRPVSGGAAALTERRSPGPLRPPDAATTTRVAALSGLCLAGNCHLHTLARRIRPGQDSQAATRRSVARPTRVSGSVIGGVLDEGT